LLLLLPIVELTRDWREGNRAVMMPSS